MKNDVFLILNEFSPQFTRKAAFYWFVIVIFGFMLRFDHYGITSFIRWLGLMPNAYPLLLNFFHASSWSLGKLMMQWMQWSISNCSLVRVNGRIVCPGDGVTVPKEAKKQPGLKRIYNSSQSNTKPKHFTGHYFGCIAFIIETHGKYFSILQAAEMQQGVDELRKLVGEKIGESTLVTRMITLMVIAASSQGTPFYACLDAFFSTSPAFTQAALHLMADGVTPWVHIITRAKNDYVAYPTKKKCKADKIKLWNLFEQDNLFQSAPHPTHPEREIFYHFIDLYWSNVIGLIRFVLVKDGKNCFILMCSDIKLTPLEIIKCYALRSKIEMNFFTLKYIIAGFCYRFWTSCWHIPAKKGENGLIMPVSSDYERASKGLKTLMAIERFVNLSIIAQGILQYLAITRTKIIWQIHSASSWLRTYSSNIPSIEVTQRSLQAQALFNSKTTCSAWIKSLLKRDDKPKISTKVPKNDTLEVAFLS